VHSPTQPWNASSCLPITTAVRNSVQQILTEQILTAWNPVQQIPTISSQSCVQNYPTADSQLVSQPVCPSVRPPSSTQEHFFSYPGNSSLGSCWFLIMGCPLWQEERFIIYSCCWALPAQYFSGLNSAGLMTIFSASILRLLQLGGQVPIFISSRSRVAQLYPQALGF
jgi:hypothetical protein